MGKEQFLISEALCLSPNAIEYHVSQQLSLLYPKKALIEGESSYFDVEAFARDGKCTFIKKDTLYNQVLTSWNAPEPTLFPWQHVSLRRAMTMMNTIMGFQDQVHEQETSDQLLNGWLEVTWEGHTLDVMMMKWREGSHHWIMADSEVVARAFFSAVSKWNMEVRGEVLVYDNGSWHKDQHLYQDIKGATFDNLILRGSLKEDIFQGLQQFFASRETYEEYGIPWKRGILFVGPPGNGKTHTVKAIINALGQPCLYVRSLQLPHGAPDDISIRQVFERARRTAPCVLVLEDLDSLLTPQNRSFFLNELDGFSANIGIVTLATTNHPERLDASILDRPSRFDRKYPFDLPQEPERLAYVTLWNSTLKDALRLSEQALTQISSQTDGFSFAYLKELFLSSMMRWISSDKQKSMEQVMLEQIGVLREQMLSPTAQEDLEAKTDANQAASIMRQMGGFAYRRMR